MIVTEIVEEYRRMSLADQKTFRRWFKTNVIVGALSVLGLIGLIYGGNSGSPTLQASKAIVQAEAR
jgi:hypothetical protein